MRMGGGLLTGIGLTPSARLATPRGPARLHLRSRPLRIRQPGVPAAVLRQLPPPRFIPQSGGHACSRPQARAGALGEAWSDRMISCLTRPAARTGSGGDGGIRTLGKEFIPTAV